MSITTDDKHNVLPLDFEKIDLIVSPSRLSRAWSGGWGYGPWPLGPRQSTVIDIRTREWTDVKSGASGRGSVSLVAHILGIPHDEAARRLVEFARVHLKVGPAAFVAAEAAS